jgi:hypothetical protein
MLGSSLVVMSLPYHHQQSLPVYNKILLPRFDKRIEVFNSASKANSVDIKIVNNSQSKTYSSNNNRMLSLEKTKLLSVSRVEVC